MSGAFIELTSYGKFFIRDENNRVWDGSSWRGFGAAELFHDYRAAFRARRAALALARDAAKAVRS